MIRSGKEQLWEIQLHSRLLLTSGKGIYRNFTMPSMRKIDWQMTLAAKGVRQSISVILLSTVGVKESKQQLEKFFLATRYTSDGLPFLSCSYYKTEGK